jgi:N-acetylmuramoyl-L-alanine amidase
MIRIIAIAIALLSSQAAAEIVAEDLRLIGDEARTRLVVDLDDEARFGVLRLTDPMRLVVDLADTAFAPGARPAEPRGLVSDYRYGLIAPGRARIVLDLREPVEVKDSFIIPAEGDQPARLVVEIVPTSRAAFVAAAREQRSEAMAMPAPAPRGIGGEPPRGKPVVVLDAGHGGIDSGAVGGKNLLEKDVTLDFALALAEALEAGGRVHPVLTRADDRFLSLADRVAIARRNDAALLISIHADTVPQDYVRGATVYTLSEDASDSLTAAVAERENRSDLLAGLALEDQPDEVASILFDLARRETRNLSVRFAKALVNQIGNKVHLNKTPWRRGDFQVLSAPDVPSVLLELGYLSNSDDVELLNSEEWRMESARRVASGVERFVAGSTAAVR